ncbi:MAG: ribonuclease HII [Nanoarchaeota archaeon]
MVNILGIDEAGRGPVIGPLVIAGVMLDESKVDTILKGVKDSKLLTKEKREELYPKIINSTNYKIIIIEPIEIDEALMSQELNLNWLEAHKSANIINDLEPDIAHIDSPSPNKEHYKEYVKKLLNNKNTELIVDHKMESKSKLVAAASILAKVTRDNEIEEIKKAYGEIGPGYMSNPITQKFLEENWEKHPEIFRKSWISWKNHKNNKEQKKLEGY